MTAAVIAITAVAGLLALVVIVARLAGVRPAGSETGQGGPRDLLGPAIVLAIVLASWAYSAIAEGAQPPPCPPDHPAVTTPSVPALPVSAPRSVPQGRITTM